MAGLIPQDFIDELLSRIDIIDVIQPRVPLKKSGSNYSACCPFHNEKTPSFTVSQVKQFYHCFGCHANGTAISFIMNYEQLHFVDAIEQLAESIGLEVPRDQSNTNLQNSRKPMYEIMQRCADYFYQQLKQTPQAVDYLKRRRLSGETAKKFQLGYAPVGWNNLEKSVQASEEQLLKLGMQIKNSEGRAYDRFRERIMFPITDRRGRVIAFGGRILEQGEPKYLNSPETSLFHKGEELYGLYEARKSAHDMGEMLIVEGYMDVIVLSQYGVQNVVATLGTATTSSHIETLFRSVPKLVFCFDGDRAGRDAAWRALKVTLPALHDGRDAHFLFLADGEDPDSTISKQGKQVFLELVKNAQSVTDFLLQHLSNTLNLNEVGDKAKLAQLAQPLINSMPIGIYKSLTIQEVESSIGIALKKQVRPDNTKPANRHEKEPPPKNRISGNHSVLMRRVVSLVLQHPQVSQLFKANQHHFDTNTVGGQLLEKLIALSNNTHEINTAKLLEHFRESEHFTGLGKLATVPLLPGEKDVSDEAAKQEFVDIMVKLTHQSSRQDAPLVEEAHRKGLLSISNNKR